MGKHYPASAESNADAQSFAVCHSNIDIFSLAVCIAIGDICISTFEPGRDGVGESSADSDNVPHCNAGSLRERRALADQPRTVCIPCRLIRSINCGYGRPALPADKAKSSSSARMGFGFASMK